MMNLDEQGHEKLRKESERSCSEPVSHKHLIKGICCLWEKRHTAELNASPTSYCRFISCCTRTCFLVPLSHWQNSKGTRCRDVKLRGKWRRCGVIIKSYQGVRGSPEIQKETIKEAIIIFDHVHI